MNRFSQSPIKVSRFLRPGKIKLEVCGHWADIEKDIVPFDAHIFSKVAVYCGGLIKQMPCFECQKDRNLTDTVVWYGDWVKSRLVQLDCGHWAGLPDAYETVGFGGGLIRQMRCPKCKEDRNLTNKTAWLGDDWDPRKVWDTLRFHLDCGHWAEFMPAGDIIAFLPEENLPSPPARDDYTETNEQKIIRLLTEIRNKGK